MAQTKSDPRSNDAWLSRRYRAGPSLLGNVSNLTTAAGGVTRCAARVPDQRSWRAAPAPNSRSLQ